MSASSTSGKPAYASHFIKEVRSCISLASLVARDAKLERRGRLHVACCPFHAEKTPSFCVFPDQHYHCFGCGAHGDTIDFLMRSRRLSFSEAVAKLAGTDKTSAFQPAARQPQQPDDNRNSELARKIWTESGLPVGTLAEDYLRSRRLELPEEPVIRFHPACPRGKDRMPAMVALMSDPATSEPRGIHRSARTRLLPPRRPITSAASFAGTVGSSVRPVWY
jgi:DNA primase